MYPRFSELADKELFEDKEFNEKYGDYIPYPIEYSELERKMGLDEK